MQRFMLRLVCIVVLQWELRIAHGSIDIGASDDPTALPDPDAEAAAAPLLDEARQVLHASPGADDLSEHRSASLPAQGDLQEQDAGTDGYPSPENEAEDSLASPAALDTESIVNLKEAGEAVESDMADVKRMDASHAWRLPSGVTSPNEWPTSSGDPVSRLQRTLGVLKSETGKAEVSLAEARDFCVRRQIPESECRHTHTVMEELGKLRRLRAAQKKIMMMRAQATQVRNEHVAVQAELQNQTKVEKRDKVGLGARMIALRSIHGIERSLKDEVWKDKRLEARWSQEVLQAEQNRELAILDQNEIQGYHVRFNSKLKGLMGSLALGDKNAKRYFDKTAMALHEAEIVNARARVLEDKAEKLRSQASRPGGARLRGRDEEKEKESESTSILGDDAQDAVDGIGEDIGLS